MFSEELSKIPMELHQRVAQLIHRDVEIRVKEYMTNIRKDVFDQLRIQHEENQALILQLKQSNP